MNFKKEAVVSARLHESTKHKLLKSGYNAADAIEWFVHEYYNNSPKRKAAIQKDMIEIKLNNLKKLECEVQVEIDVLEKKLSEFADIPLGVDEINIPDVEELLPSNLQEAIDRIKPIYEEKSTLFVGSSTSPEEALNLFIDSCSDFVYNVYSEFGKGLKWKDFKELLLSEVVS